MLWLSKCKKNAQVWNVTERGSKCCLSYEEHLLKVLGRPDLLLGLQEYYLCEKKKNRFRNVKLSKNVVLRGNERCEMGATVVPVFYKKKFHTCWNFSLFELASVKKSIKRVSSYSFRRFECELLGINAADMAAPTLHYSDSQKNNERRVSDYWSICYAEFNAAIRLKIVRHDLP